MTWVGSEVGSTDKLDTESEVSTAGNFEMFAKNLRGGFQVPKTNCVIFVINKFGYLQVNDNCGSIHLISIIDNSLTLGIEASH